MRLERRCSELNWNVLPSGVMPTSASVRSGPTIVTFENTTDVYGKSVDVGDGAAVCARDDAALDERTHLVDGRRTQEDDAAPVAAIAQAGGLQAREHDRRAAHAVREDLAAALDDERCRSVALHRRPWLDRQRAG